MPNPLVSIFTPCYNHEKYLDEYFQGLLSQTYTNTELIFIDDGSTDGSWEKACRYRELLAAKFTRVIMERHENIGPTEEFLLAFPRISGDLLSILESDDYYLPTKVEENVRYLQANPEMGAVHSDTDFMYGRWMERRHWKAQGVKIPVGEIFEPLLLRNFIMTCSLTCRLDAFRQYVSMSEYLAKGYILRDYAFCLDLARHIKFGYIDKPLARYRVLANSFSHSADPGKTYKRSKNAVLMKLDYIKKFGGSAAARALALEQLDVIEFRHKYELGQAAECLSAYKRLLQKYPHRHRNLFDRLRAWSVRYKPIWSTVRRIDEMQMLHALRTRTIASWTLLAET